MKKRDRDYILGKKPGARGRNGDSIMSRVYQALDLCTRVSDIRVSTATCVGEKKGKRTCRAAGTFFKDAIFLAQALAVSRPRFVTIISVGMRKLILPSTKATVGELCPRAGAAR